VKQELELSEEYCAAPNTVIEAHEHRVLCLEASELRCLSS
jgi:hypothetical protein